MKATQDGQVIVKSSDKMWSTGERNGNPLEYLCLENFMDSMKRQEVMTPGDEPPRPPRSYCIRYATGAQSLTAPVRNKPLGQSGNDTQLWMCLMVIEPDGLVERWW